MIKNFRNRLPEVERPTDHDQGQPPPNFRGQLNKLVIKIAQGNLWLGVAAIIFGSGGVYLLSQHRRQVPASVLTPRLTPAPTVPPTPIALTTSRAHQASPPPISDPFEDGMKRVLQAGSSGFLELRGKLTKAENGSGPYPLFRFRKIYEGTFIFGGADSAQLEEVYYSDSSRPAYNYHLYFQESSSKDPRYVDLRRRLDAMLSGFVHTFGAGYDAWAGSDGWGTAVLLSNRDVPGSAEVQVHVAFPAPRW